MVRLAKRRDEIKCIVNLNTIRWMRENENEGGRQLRKKRESQECSENMENMEIMEGQIVKPKKKKKHRARNVLIGTAVVVIGLFMFVCCGDSDDSTSSGSTPATVDVEAVKEEMGHFDSGYIMTQLEGDMLDNYLAFYDAIYNFRKEFRFPHPIEDEDEFYALYLAMWFECPETFQLDYDDFSTYKDRDTRYITGCQLNYRMDQDTYQSALSQCQGIASALQKQTEGMSDYDKELYVYEYLAENIIYDDSAENDSNIYGALVEGRAVCSGNSQAFKYVCDAVGLPCVGMFSYEYGQEGNGHAWNAVCLDGNWYDVDLTADTDTVDQPMEGYLTYSALNVPRTWITDTGHPVTSYYAEYFDLPESNSFDMDYHVVNDEFVAEGEDYAEYFCEGVSRAYENGDALVYLQFESDEDYNNFIDQRSDLQQEWLDNYSSSEVYSIGGTYYRDPAYRTIIFVPEFE